MAWWWWLLLLEEGDGDIVVFVVVAVARLSVCFFKCRFLKNWRGGWRDER